MRGFRRWTRPAALWESRPRLVRHAGRTAAFLAAPAGARTSGKASFRGQLIAINQNGSRHVVSSIATIKGVFTGIGTVVEIPNRPGDPDNVVRDDLVFKGGKMHLRTTDQTPEFSGDPQTCAVKATIKQTARVQGGTGRFRNASGRFRSMVRAWGVAGRNPDGTCNMDADLLIDADLISATGTLSF
jgi:hypothetical protein